jgi:hypothetical protein
VGEGREDEPFELVTKDERATRKADQDQQSSETQTKPKMDCEEKGSILRLRFVLPRSSTIGATHLVRQHLPPMVVEAKSLWIVVWRGWLCILFLQEVLRRDEDAVLIAVDTFPRTKDDVAKCDSHIGLTYSVLPTLPGVGAERLYADFHVT